MKSACQSALCNFESYISYNIFSWLDLGPNISDRDDIQVKTQGQDDGGGTVAFNLS